MASLGLELLRHLASWAFWNQDLAQRLCDRSLDAQEGRTRCCMYQGSVHATLGSEDIRFAIDQGLEGVRSTGLSAKTACLTRILNSRPEHVLSLRVGV